VGAQAGEQTGDGTRVAQPTEQGVDARGAHRREEVAQVEPQRQATRDVRGGETEDGTTGTVRVRCIMWRHVDQQLVEQSALDRLQAALRNFEESVFP